MRKMQMIRPERRFQPAQFLAVSFVAAIGVGTLLLMLPVSSTAGRVSLIDALFTSTSAVCVTGLIVRDTAAAFTPFGQGVILLLFQLGGLGIMTFSTLVLLATGKSISIKDRLVIQQNFHHTSPKDVRSLIRSIFVYTLGIEAVGALLLFLRLKNSLSGGSRFFAALFHSVSAFCNAGFSIFGNSFEAYRGDPLVNSTLMMLIVLGGLGFLVLREGQEILGEKLKGRRLRASLHTKLVLSVTAGLIVGGFGLFLMTEWNRALAGMPAGEKLWAALFQTVTARTAGFNTMNLAALGSASVFLLIILMFIGASPGSTGGGVKTSTIGVLFAFLRSKLAARGSVSLYDRTLPLQLITRAYTVVTLGIMVIALASFVIFVSHPWARMQDVFFEVISAFGTVGLSLGLTPRLDALGKAVLVLTMYIGRIGPLTLLYAFSRERPRGRYEYAHETVMIG